LHKEAALFLAGLLRQAVTWLKRVESRIYGWLPASCERLKKLRVADKMRVGRILEQQFGFTVYAANQAGSPQLGGEPANLMLASRYPGITSLR
jgi:hypothetical protein